MDIFQIGFYNLIRSYDDVLGWFLEYDDPGCFLEYDDDKDQIFKLETYFAGRLVGPRSDEGSRLTWYMLDQIWLFKVITFDNDTPVDF